jgi:hypothetical protein
LYAVQFAKIRERSGKGGHFSLRSGRGLKYLNKKEYFLAGLIRIIIKTNIFLEGLT